MLIIMAIVSKVKKSLVFWSCCFLSCRQMRHSSPADSNHERWVGICFMFVIEWLGQLYLSYIGRVEGNGVLMEDVQPSLGYSRVSPSSTEPWCNVVKLIVRLYKKNGCDMKWFLLFMTSRAFKRNLVFAIGLTPVMSAQGTYSSFHTSFGPCRISRRRKACACRFPRHIKLSFYFPMK